MSRHIDTAGVSRPPFSLEGSKVLVTGASRGIGAAIAVAVATAGADVAIGHLDSAAEAAAVAGEIEALGRQVLTIQADVADPDDARRMIATAEDHLGHIDGLVNNAGIMPTTPVMSLDDEEWDRVVRTNLYGPFYCTRAALPAMVERGSGSVVMISSRLGQVGFPTLAHYSASKAGLIGLTKSLAREVGPLGIRVNAVAPGPTITDMTRDVLVGEAAQQRLAELPAGRFGLPDDVARAVVFLLSDAADMFHGQTLNPNGGGFMP